MASLTDEPDNLVSISQIPPQVSYFRQFIDACKAPSSLMFKLTICGIGAAHAVGTLTCFFKQDGLGIFIMLFMSLATVWVSDANENPYS